MAGGPPRPVWVLGAAAALLGLASLLSVWRGGQAAPVHRPRGRSQPLPTFASAWQTLSEAGTAEEDVVVSVAGPGGVGSTSGSGTLVLGGGSAAFTVQAGGVASGAPLSVRVIGPWLYVDPAPAGLGSLAGLGTWFAIPTAGVTDPSAVGLPASWQGELALLTRVALRPGALLRSLDAADPLPLRRSGPATIRERTTVGYLATVSSVARSSSAARAVARLGTLLLDGTPAGPISAEVWIGPDGHLRQLQLQARPRQIQAGSGLPGGPQGAAGELRWGSAQVTLTLDFASFGVPVTVAPPGPASVEVLEPLS